MDDITYYGSLALIASLAYMFFRNNSTFLLFIVLSIGAYIIYSNETGYTATEFKNSMVNSINEEAQDFTHKKGLDNYNEDQEKY